MRQTTVFAQYGAEENFISGLPCAIEAELPKVQRELLRAWGLGMPLLLTAPTGSGKSARIAQYVVATLRRGVYIAQPRRIAALSVEKRRADKEIFLDGNRIFADVYVRQFSTPGFKYNRVSVQFLRQIGDQRAAFGDLWPQIYRRTFRIPLCGSATRPASRSRLP